MSRWRTWWRCHILLTMYLYREKRHFKFKKIFRAVYWVKIMQNSKNNNFNISHDWVGWTSYQLFFSNFANTSILSYFNAVCYLIGQLFVSLFDWTPMHLLRRFLICFFALSMFFRVQNVFEDCYLTQNCFFWCLWIYFYYTSKFTARNTKYKNARA